jgi:hypothetical protein
MGLVTNVEGIAREMGIPIGINPMKPGDVILNKSFQSMPPMCPVCWPTKILIYPTDQNSQTGNQLFECLNGDGHYLAVWRVRDQTWGQRPGAERPNWVAPIQGGRAAVKPTKKKPGKKSKAAIKGRPRPVPDDGEEDEEDLKSTAAHKKRKVKTRK